jgi:hypothetical protein
VAATSPAAKGAASAAEIAPSPRTASTSGIRQPLKLTSHHEPANEPAAEEPAADATTTLDIEAWKKRAKTPTLRRTAPKQTSP